MNFLAALVIILFNYLHPIENYQTSNKPREIIIDSNFSFDEATSGIKIPAKIKSSLSLVEVTYFSFDKKLHRGQVLIHKDLAAEIKKIFKTIESEGFPVGKVIPVIKYNWSDSNSMEDNNSSGFNYRTVSGSLKLSRHATGRAFDLNPMYNPQIKRGITSPKGAKYDTNKEGTLDNRSAIVQIFIKSGWKWGGNWKSSKDYQHFEK